MRRISSSRLSRLVAVFLVAGGLTVASAFEAAARPVASARAAVLARPSLATLRAYTAPDHTRLVVELRGGVPAARFRSDVVDGRPAIVIDLPGVGVGDVAPLNVRDSVVESVDVRRSAEGASVVVHLLRGAAYDHFTLGAADGRPDRVVLDVKRDIAPAVLAQQDSEWAALKNAKVRIVAIDAGHGGEDYGAIGPNGTAEKNVALAIAESLAARISATPGFRAVLTRTGDYFVPLRERTRIAHRAKADLFVSIHANASRNRQATGTEVYFLSPHGATDEVARATAQRENEADLVGGLPARSDDTVGGILLDLAQTATLERSGLLAEGALDRLATAPAVATRGVKQAGFVVLKTVDVPSILVETAFISNPREERQLADSGFQQALADRLAVAIVGYFSRYTEE